MRRTVPLTFATLIVTSIPHVLLAADGFEVTAFRKSSENYYEIIIQGTSKGQEIVCGLKNAAGDIIASDTQYTDALATKVLISYSGDDAVSAVCALNE